MNKIRSISISALLVFALTTVVVGKVNSIATIENNTTYNLGTVAIYSGSTPFYVNVPSKGTYYTNVPSTPTMVVVNSYVVQQGQYGIVTLQSGVKVKVTLSGNNIVVQDQSIVQ